MSLLRVSEPSVEGKFTVSKWIKHQVLLDPLEMKTLFAHLGEISFFNVSEILPLEGLQIEQESFLKAYESYANGLKEGKTIFDFAIKRHLSCAVSSHQEALYATSIGDKYMAKPLRPLIQLQQHRFFPSKSAGEFHSMVMSQESIHWGVQFAYPQIFHDGNSYTKVSDPDRFPNTPLFTKLVRWLRAETQPTTFVWEGKKIATAFRLGKNCFSWIHRHPQLVQQGIEVHVY